MTSAAAALLVVGVAVVVSGCGGGKDSVAEHPSRPSSSAPTHQTPTHEAPTSPPPTRSTRDRPRPLRVSVALDTVDHLARGIGPRHSTSPAFARAARWLSGELRDAGYVVREQRFRVPGGDSWGVPVRAGGSVNVIATPPGFDPRGPHLVVGAHLDTVPLSPGAEDDGSGIGVLLMLARALSGTSSVTRLPVVLIGFGAEEPRGSTDADHHFGSRAYAARLSAAERRAVRGMLAMDRVGVGTVVPVCGAGNDVARAEVLRAGRRAGVPMLPCENRSSDHWSFVEKGMPGVRIGGTSYAGYHSPADVPAVENPAQLQRTARLVMAWLR
jgi:peptidase M28-like protein